MHKITKDLIVPVGTIYTRAKDDIHIYTPGFCSPVGTRNTNHFEQTKYSLRFAQNHNSKWFVYPVPTGLLERSLKKFGPKTNHEKAV